MKHILSPEKGILIAPFFIVLFITFVPLSASFKSIAAVLSLSAIIITPYYRPYVLAAFNTLWGRAGLVFFAYIVIACLWSDAPLGMRISVIDKYSKLIYLPILAAGFIHPKTRNWALNSYFAVMLLTSVLSFLKQKGIIELNNPGDSGEVFHNHIATGFMVAMAVYFALLRFLESDAGRWSRAYYLLMIVVGSYQIFFLNTGRTGYVVYGLLMTLFLVQKLSFKKALIGIIALAASIGLIYSLSPLMQERTAALISDVKFLKKHEENTSIGFRVQFHDYARSLFKEHPLFGIGTGGFKYHFSKDQPIPAWGPKLNDPHSQYWLTLVEQGVLGLTLLVIFLASLFVTAFQASTKARPYLLGMLVSFTMGCITDTILCYSTAGSLLIIFCAMGFSEFLVRAPASVTIKDRVIPTPGNQVTA